MERQLQHPSLAARRGFAEQFQALVKNRKKSEDEVFDGTKGRAGFQAFLKRRFGTIVAGWRVMDPHRYGRLSFQEFHNALRSLGYCGNLKRLWAELDAGRRGCITIGDIDPEVLQIVGSFKSEMKRVYGDLLTGWRKGLQGTAEGPVEEKQLQKCCEHLGLSIDSGKLMRMMNPGPEGSGLKLVDFDPEAHKSWYTTDFWKPQEAPSLYDSAQRSLEALQGSLHLEDKGAASRPEPPSWWCPDPLRVMSAAEFFKVNLQKRFGSIFSAWREELDRSHNGQITFVEFCQAYRRLGMSGDLQELWRQLDITERGTITLEELDPVADKRLAEFRQKFTKAYGNMMLAWLKGIDLSRNGFVSEKQWKEACKQVDLGEKEATRLFSLLRPRGAPLHITLEDFDRPAFLALHYGDFRMLMANGQTLSGEDSDLVVERQEKDEALTMIERFNHTLKAELHEARKVAGGEEYAKQCHIFKYRTFGAEVKEGFEQLCLRKYGSVIAAWRLCLDAQNKGSLTFRELCTASKRLGFRGDLVGVWQRYVGKEIGRGLLTMKTLDERTHLALEAFCLFLYEAGSGDLAKAWKTTFKKDVLESVSKEEFQKGLKGQDQLAEDLERLFICIQPLFGRDHFYMWDVETLYKPWKQLLDASQRRKPLQEAAEPSFGIDDLTDHELKHIALGLDQNLDVGCVSPPLLRRAFCRFFNSTAAAWRFHLDPHGRGYVGFNEFMSLLDACSVFGNVLQLWRDLIKRKGTEPPDTEVSDTSVQLQLHEQGVLRYKDLDPASHQLLETAREHLFGEGRSLEEVWEELIRGRGLLDEARFVSALKDSGLSLAGEADEGYKQLFDLLKVDHGHRSLKRPQDLEGLFTGLSLEERSKLCRPSLSLSPLSPTASVLSSGRELMEEPTSPKDKWSRLLKEFHSQLHTTTTLAGFKLTLLAKFGSLFSAWRKLLDKEQKGVASESNFAEAARAFGVQHVTELWKQLDPKRTGLITLRDFHPESADAFEELQRLLMDKYLSCKDGWQKVFDPMNIRRCEKEDFVPRATELGYSKDPGRLFELLQPQRHYLTYEDIWEDTNRNLFETTFRESSLKSFDKLLKQTGQKPIDESLQPTFGTATTVLKTRDYAPVE